MLFLHLEITLLFGKWCHVFEEKVKGGGTKTKCLFQRIKQYSTICCCVNYSKQFNIIIQNKTKNGRWDIACKYQFLSMKCIPTFAAIKITEETRRKSWRQQRN